MAKKTKEEESAEAAELAARNAETVRLSNELGRDDANWLKGMNEADPFEKSPQFMPGKPGFDQVGKTFLGEFVRMKGIENPDSPWAKLDKATGKMMTYLSLFKDPKGNAFCIWSFGALKAAVSHLRPGDKLQITYQGLGEVLKKGQNPPHSYKFVGVRADGSKLVFDWDAINDAKNEHVPPAPQGQTQAQAHN